MSYNLKVGGIDGVIFAHIHQGSEDENGPIVITFFNTSEPTKEVGGLLKSGKFTAADFDGPLQGKSVSDLVAAVDSGQAYVNVNTESNPAGELRGTIR